MARTELCNWTELNWHALVFDELTNKQAVMHYSEHRLTASMITWLCARTRQPVTSMALLARPLVTSSKSKPCQFSSVTSLCKRFFETPDVMIVSIDVSPALNRCYQYPPSPLLSLLLDPTRKLPAYSLCRTSHWANPIYLIPWLSVHKRRHGPLRPLHFFVRVHALHYSQPGVCSCA